MYMCSARQKLQGSVCSRVVYRSYNPAARCSDSQANSLAGCFKDLFLGWTSLAFDHSVGVFLRTSALKSSKLASGTFLRLSGAYACTGWASGTSKSSSCCAAAAAAHTFLCNRVASYMKLWVLH
ncbi:hypothetical protein BY996DRAFT_6418135 [Phakopsora pachyrhizi]|nr:hypothetical protein BY996DRAFT_6418135 [Phakopsora pachyrhizi]